MPTNEIGHQKLSEILFTLVKISEHFQASLSSVPPNQLEKAQKEIVQKIITYIAQFQYILKSDSRISLFRAIMIAMDDLVRTMDVAEKFHISCKRGCSFCCHQNVEITEDEGAVIAEHCKNENITISKEYLHGQLKFSELDIAFQENSACVFLTNGECSIYDVRPLICRKYFVATPAEQCDTKKYRAGKIATIADSRMEALMASIAFIITDIPGRLPEIMLKYAK